MKWIKRAWMPLLCLLAVLVLTQPIRAEAAETVASGTCGDNLTWVLDSEGTLTISGEGKMANYSSGGAPWYAKGTSITNVVLEDGVTSIDNYAFEDCSSLTGMTIPEGVTSIGDGVFSRCGGLTRLTVSGENPVYHSDGNCIIGTASKTLIAGCSTSVIPADGSVTSIGESAFSGCSMTSMTIPGSVTSIGDYAFHDCLKMKNVSIPEGVTSIGRGAFGWCSSLTSVTIPEGVTSIGEHAFYYDTLLSQIVFQGNAPVIASNAFSVVAATAYYPANDATWTSDKMQDYGGSITWVSYSGSECAHQWDEGVETQAPTCTTGGKITYTCQLCGETKAEDTLPLGHKYVERTCTRCGNRKFVLAYDVWSFANSDTSFGPVSEGYYISNADFQRLIKNLTTTERYALLIRETEKKIGDKGAVSVIKQKLSNYNIDHAGSAGKYIDWGGSCYGMSTWVCLNSYGIRKASDITSSISELSSYSNRPEVESAINYYHFQQKLDPAMCAKKECMSLSQPEQIERLEKLGKHANETGRTFLICYSFYSGFKSDGSCDTDTAGGHAVVGYGWEEIEPKEISVLDTKYTYNYRILIYDCSDPKHTLGDRNLYYNDDGVWCVPGWEIVSDDSKTADDRSDNANLEIVTSNVSSLNSVDYISGECAAPIVVVLNTLETTAEMSYTIECNDIVANISGFTVTSETENHGIIATVDSNITTDGKAISTTSTAILPDSKSYTVTSEHESMSFSLRNEERLSSCAVGSSGSVTFLQDGALSVVADEPAPYYLNLVANDGCFDLPWYQIEIVGANAQSVSAEITEDGILVHSDDLSDVAIAVTDKYDSREVVVSTDQESLLITDKNGKVAVCVDADGDGKYEQNVARCSGHIAAEGKHNCDICGEKLSDCIDANGDGKCDICGTELSKPETSDVIRVAGSGRWGTAIKVADELKTTLGVEKFNAIIVASGNEFADALAGSYLSTQKSAPILLSWGQGGKYAYLDTNNIDYIKDNLVSGGTVYILGGTSAVPTLYEDGLAGYSVKRLGGGNRFETNQKILNEVGVAPGSEVLVCTAYNFADSLSASATGKPVLLVYTTDNGKNYGVDDAFLQNLKGCKFTIIGGESAVSAGVKIILESYGSVDRLAGGNRFETSVMVAERYFENPTSAVLAYAWNYPDGLCGGALAYAMKAPLILTMENWETAAVTYAKENNITTGYVLGGEKLVSNSIVREIFTMAEDATITQK